MATTFTSSLRGVPMKEEQLAAAILRLQQMQDDGGEGQKSFDQSVQRVSDTSKVQDDMAARGDELAARKSKAQLSTAENTDALKDFLARPTYRQLWEQSQNMPARKVPQTIDIGGIAGSGGYTNILGGLLK